VWRAPPGGGELLVGCLFYDAVSVTSVDDSVISE
jgi:hypothetical protein